MYKECKPYKPTFINTTSYNHIICVSHREIFFEILLNQNKNEIVFTIFRLIWNQTDSVRLVPNQSCILYTCMCIERRYTCVDSRRVNTSTTKIRYVIAAFHPFDITLYFIIARSRLILSSIGYIHVYFHPIFFFYNKDILRSKIKILNYSYICSFNTKKSDRI